MCNLRQSGQFTPVYIRRKLSMQLILQIITYSELVHSKLDSCSAYKIDVVFNQVARYVYGWCRHDHISAWRTRLLGCNIVEYQKARSWVFLFRLISTKTPSYLYNKLVFFCKSVQSCNLVFVPDFNYVNSTRLFFVNVIRIWNSIPVATRNICTKATTDKLFFYKLCLNWQSKSIFKYF